MLILEELVENWKIQSLSPKKLVDYRIYVRKRFKHSLNLDHITFNYNIYTYIYSIVLWNLSLFLSEYSISKSTKRTIKKNADVPPEDAIFCINSSI